ncbi:winged helix-turn-helix domain-containing protein [Streptomyces bambusae]|uniref:winged helix-turn-helix domain-containing protein n=1 Tax=Streptomyces bambusae TaxID=1550616 RepID=UPI001CFCD1E4|nr:winged helix-turn-helix domain-containing protein [Streptomyces bambusae]MCB5164186.1 winged helix-turn-helix domain-containing protein [Streptomyces bambusae]
MIRIHFTAEDLARTRVGTTVGAAAETYQALSLLDCPDRTLPFRPWRTRVARELGPEVRPLLALLPRSGPAVDLFTLVGDTGNIDEAAESLLATPAHRLREELGNLRFDPRHLPWVKRFADGDREAREEVAHALRAVHRTAVAPWWPRAAAHLDAVRADVARTLLDGGVERVLETLCVPLIRWRPPVLEVDHPRDKDIRLGGRGLVLVPTVFSRREAEVYWDPSDDTAPHVLSVPTLTDPVAAARLWEDGEPPEQALGALLGRTRAAALRATVHGCNTTELARRLGVTPAAASQHATVLRNANLITTNRRGGAVLHTITALGSVLLESVPGGRVR